MYVTFRYEANYTNIGRAYDILQTVDRSYDEAKRSYFITTLTIHLAHCCQREELGLVRPPLV